MPTRITVLGGGPAGLTTARLLKLRRPAWEVSLHERQSPESSFGYGVGVGQSALDALADADPEMRAAVERMALKVETSEIAGVRQSPHVRAEAAGEDYQQSSCR